MGLQMHTAIKVPKSGKNLAYLVFSRKDDIDESELAPGVRAKSQSLLLT